MKISISILCLVVIFGNISCRIYSDEDVNLIERITDDGSHDKRSVDVSSERYIDESLSRYKRASMLSPITDMALMGFDSHSKLYNIFKTTMDFANFVTDLLSGQKRSCREELSLKSIVELMTNPLQTIKTVLCHIINFVGHEGRVMAHNLWTTFSNFLKTVFLPTLHTVLNAVLKTRLLPPSLAGMIMAFNAFYKFLQIIGYLK